MEHLQAGPCQTEGGMTRGPANGTRPPAPDAAMQGEGTRVRGGGEEMPGENIFAQVCKNLPRPAYSGCPVRVLTMRTVD